MIGGRGSVREPMSGSSAASPNPLSSRSRGGAGIPAWSFSSSTCFVKRGFWSRVPTRGAASRSVSR